MAISAIHDKSINNYLNSYNIEHSNLGYTYLMDGIRMILDEDVERGKISALYRALAEKHNTKPRCVEESIRRAIKRTDRKMTNKEFILLAADNLIYS